MRTYKEVEEAQKRALAMYDSAQENGRSAYFAMTYEDGMKEALDWVMEDSDDDPTKG